MKKLLTILFTLIFISGLSFGQNLLLDQLDESLTSTEVDFGSEAEDLEVIALMEQEDDSNKMQYFIGFDFSILGVEPTFQFVRNEHMEFQAGISFVQYNGGPNKGGVGIVAPQCDFGYRTKMNDSWFFTIGLTEALGIGVQNAGTAFADALAIYLKVAYNIGFFELGFKTYAPLFTAIADPGEGLYEAKFAGGEWNYLLGGLAFTCFEVKVKL